MLVFLIHAFTGEQRVFDGIAQALDYLDRQVSEERYRWSLWDEAWTDAIGYKKLKDMAAALKGIHEKIVETEVDFSRQEITDRATADVFSYFIEKRRFKRFVVSTHLEWKIADSESLGLGSKRSGFGRVQDLSLGGLAFSCEDPALCPGAVIDVEMNLVEGSLLCSRAKVIGVSEDLIRLAWLRPLEQSEVERLFSWLDGFSNASSSLAA